MAYPNVWATQQMAEQINGVRFVKGFDGARECPCLPGRTLLMDEDEQIFYIKEVVNYGNVSIRRYSFEEMPEPTPPQYVTKEEFNELKERYESAVSKLESLGLATAGPQPGPENVPVSGAAGSPEASPIWSDQPATAR